MKADWKYISFENCLERVPKTEKIKSSEYQQSGAYPIISQEESLISGFWDDCEDVFHIEHPIIIFGDHTRVLKYVDFDFVVGADGVKILSPKPFLLPKFLYFYLRWVNIPSLGYSRHFKLLKELYIPILSLTDQERIVSELDLLSEIIDKQKAQLKELDNLAQSIFYDMFGDPVENEKGWEIVLFKDFFRLKSGDNLSEKNFNQGDYPVYGGNGISGYHNTFNKEGEHIIIGRVGAYCGNVRYVKGPFWLTDNAFDTFFDISVFNYQFVCTLLNSINLHQYANHAAQPVISNTGLKNIQIIVPPIELQNTFAEKIERIEKQKETIIRSITETQQLFDSRMAYWFD